MVELQNPAALAAPVGQYSHVAVAPAAGLVFVAGQVAVDEQGQVVGAGDFDAQVERCFRNLGAALAAAGSGWDRLVKMTTYLTSHDGIAGFMRARGRLYEELYPDGAYPPNTLVVVSGLVRPELLVEIEAMALVD